MRVSGTALQLYSNINAVPTKEKKSPTTYSNPNPAFSLTSGASPWCVRGPSHNSCEGGWRGQNITLRWWSPPPGRLCTTNTQSASTHPLHHSMSVSCGVCRDGDTLHHTTPTLRQHVQINAYVHVHIHTVYSNDIS